LRRVRDGRLIVPVDPVQPSAAGLLDPIADGRLTDPEPAGDLALGQAAADGLDDLTTVLSR
jgi:hypothetical protein